MKKTILLAEDALFNAEYASQLLKSMDYEVKVIENGALAVETVKKTDYFLILMDLNMPVMDGFTAAEKIREFNKTVPIIALTATVTPQLQEKMKSCGMLDYIMKPFNPVEFTSKLKMYSVIS